MSIIINDVDEAEAVNAILHELHLANAKHPNYPTDPLRRAALMCEEAGEALQAALDMTRVRGRLDIDRGEELYEEVIHTGAMAVKLLVAMIRERNNPPKREKLLS